MNIRQQDAMKTRGQQLESGYKNVEVDTIILLLCEIKTKIWELFKINKGSLKIL